MHKRLVSRVITGGAKISNMTNKAKNPENSRICPKAAQGYLSYEAVRKHISPLDQV